MKFTYYTVCLFYLFIPNFIIGQKVTDVIVEHSDGIVSITYNIDINSDITLKMSKSGGAFIQVNDASGDVGENIPKGTGKKILYRINEEYFVCHYCIFRVEATKSNFFIDTRDQQWYSTFDLNGQTWLAENLNYVSIGSRSPSQNIEISSLKTHGLLYNWEAASKACPIGWRLPNTQDWNQLINKLGGEIEAGRRMKTSYYSLSWQGSTDKNFNAVPSGYILQNQTVNIYFNSAAAWWVDDSSDIFTSSAFTITAMINEVKRNTYQKNSYLSVRCIQD